MFKSINYTRIVCEKCKAVTTIEPGVEVSGLNCDCKEEASVPYKNITVWTNGEHEVEVLGEFENGDFEIKYVDGTRSYRMPHQSLIHDFDEMIREDIPPPLENIVPDGEFTFRSFDYEALAVKELRELAKDQGITSVTRMNKQTLIERLTHGKD